MTANKKPQKRYKIYCKTSDLYFDQRYNRTTNQSKIGVWRSKTHIITYFDYLLRNNFKKSDIRSDELDLIENIVIYETDLSTNKVLEIDVKDAIKQKIKERQIWKEYGWQVARAYRRVNHLYADSKFKHMISFPYSFFTKPNRLVSKNLFSEARAHLKTLDILHRRDYIYSANVLVFADYEHAILCKLSFADDIKQSVNVIDLRLLTIAEGNTRE